MPLNPIPAAARRTVASGRPRTPALAGRVLSALLLFLIHRRIAALIASFEQLFDLWRAGRLPLPQAAPARAKASPAPIAPSRAARLATPGRDRRPTAPRRPAPAAPAARIPAVRPAPPAHRRAARRPIASPHSSRPAPPRPVAEISPPPGRGALAPNSLR